MKLVNLVKIANIVKLVKIVRPVNQCGGQMRSGDKMESAGSLSPITTNKSYPHSLQTGWQNSTNVFVCISNSICLYFKM